MMYNIWANYSQGIIKLFPKKQISLSKAIAINN